MNRVPSVTARIRPSSSRPTSSSTDFQHEHELRVGPAAADRLVGVMSAKSKRRWKQASRRVSCQAKHQRAPLPSATQRRGTSPPRPMEGTACRGEAEACRTCRSHSSRGGPAETATPSREVLRVRRIRVSRHHAARQPHQEGRRRRVCGGHNDGVGDPLYHVELSARSSPVSLCYGPIPFHRLFARCQPTPSIG